MYFVQYTGDSDRFIYGKIYVAKDELESKAKTKRFFCLEDECGERFVFDFNDSPFVKHEFVFAVCVRENEKIYEGKVCKIIGTDFNDERYYFLVEDMGYFNSNSFEIIDKTNLFVGMVVRDTSSGFWKKITSIMEDKNIIQVDGGHLKHISCFDFAICEGSIATYPVVYCTDDNGSFLTKEKHYYPKKSNKKSIVVKNDKGKESQYSAERFSWKK